MRVVREEQVDEISDLGDVSRQSQRLVVIPEPDKTVCRMGRSAGTTCEVLEHMFFPVAMPVATRRAIQQG